jgi:hypothetical protein
MQTFIGVVASLIFLAGGGFVVWALFAFLRALSRAPHYSTARTFRTTSGDDSDAMNDGDYYNGPGGYHATGGYQNSFYGQIFDEDEDDRHHG